MKAIWGAFGVLGVAAASGVFNPLDYGAKGDGVHVDTVAVRTAASKAAQAGGGMLYFPGGYTFLTSAFNLTSNLVVQVDGVVMADSTGNLWPLIEPLPWYGGGSDAQQSGELMWQGWVYAKDAVNVSITGSGTLNGNGSAWWACKHGDFSDPPCRGYSRPHMFLLDGVSDLKMSNVFIRDSPNWTIHLAKVTNAHVFNVTVNNPADAPNADGIDVDCSVNVLVEHSTFSVGDDACCVKSGIDYLGRTFGRTSENITFRYLNVESGHGITIGSEMSAGVRNVTFHDITMHGTENGPRMKSQRGRGGIVQDIFYKNIAMTSVGTSFDLTLNYHSEPPTNATATPSFQNVVFQNVTSDSPDIGWLVDGLPESIMKNFVFNDVKITNPKHPVEICDYIQGSCSTNTSSTCPPCLVN